MHFRLDPELVQQLAGHGNILGMKDSAGDVECLARYVESQDDTFSVLTGHGGSWQQALALGVRGGILAVALFAAELSLAVRDAMQQGSLTRLSSCKRGSRRWHCKSSARWASPASKRPWMRSACAAE